MGRRKLARQTIFLPIWVNLVWLTSDSGTFCLSYTDHTWTKMTYITTHYTLHTCPASKARIYTVKFNAVVQLCPTLCDPMASLSITNPWSLLKFMFIESVTLFDHLILCRPLLLPPSIFPSIRVFSNESVLCIRWPKYWSFSFSISLTSEYSGLISFRIDWLDFLAVQSSPTPQFKRISSLALRFLYSPTLTSIQDYWKNHSLD